MVVNSKLDSLFIELNAIARDGASVIVKLDGARTAELFYSVVISGGNLKEDYFRKDGGDLIPLIQEGVDYYNKSST